MSNLLHNVPRLPAIYMQQHKKALFCSVHEETRCRGVLWNTPTCYIPSAPAEVYTCIIKQCELFYELYHETIQEPDFHIISYKQLQSLLDCMHAYTRRSKYNYSERNIVLQSNGSVSCSLEMSCHLGKEVILTKSSKNSNCADNK